jgi:hypothetical protein
MNSIETVNCVVQSSWPSVWSFGFGALTCAAIQAGAISFLLALSKPLFPPHIHVFLVLTLALIRMAVSAAIKKVRSSISNAFVTQVPAAQANDPPVKAMRKPRVLDHSLTSEFMKSAENTKEEGKIE